MSGECAVACALRAACACACAVLLVCYGRLAAAGEARRAGESEEWLGSLRASLMRDNYDYPAPPAPPAAPGDPNAAPGETADPPRESSDVSGASADENGQPSAEHDYPTPRSQLELSTALPIVDPPVGLQNSRRSDRGRESRLRAGRLHPAAVATPPGTAHNAALIDEINREFEAKRRNFLKSLNELEDQLKPMYKSGLGAGSLPYTGPGGAQRYRVFGNAMSEILPVDKYTFLLDNFPEASLAVDLIPETPKRPARPPEPREGHKTRYRVKQSPARSRSKPRARPRLRSAYLAAADLQAFLSRGPRRAAVSLEDASRGGASSPEVVAPGGDAGSEVVAPGMASGPEVVAPPDAPGPLAAGG